MAFTQHLKRLNAHNLHTLRTSPLSELSGSLGDLGTLLPLLIALTLTHSISLPSTLVFTGLANILTGLTFGLPLPVQPMKAIAAVAVARSFSRAETTAAGVFVAGAVGVFAVTGLLRWFTRVIPVPVVKGIQVGAGLSLVVSAGSGGLLAGLGWVRPGWSDNYLWALSAFLLLLLATATARGQRVPYALVVVVLGLLLAGLRLRVSDDGGGGGDGGGERESARPLFNIWRPDVEVPLPKTFWKATLSAGLGQLPLTTLNSIIAVCHLSADLLPAIPAPSVTAMGVSVAAMNLVGCWFGAMPACHGSGGLAGQYRFGARSGASVIVLGVVKLLLGLFVGDGLLDLLAAFPKSLLGIMVIAAGVELAKVGESLNVGARDLWEDVSGEENEGGEEHAGGKRPREVGEKERQDRWAVMMVTVAGLLAFRNDAVGFIAGMLWHWGTVEGPKRYGEWRGYQRQQNSYPWYPGYGSRMTARSGEGPAEDEEARGLLDENHDAPDGRAV